MQTKKRKLIIISCITLVVVFVGMLLLYTNRRSVCSGADKLGLVGMCVVDTSCSGIDKLDTHGMCVVAGGCKYNPTYGPKAALC